MKYLLYILLVFVTITQVFSQSKFEQGLKAMAEENWLDAIYLFQEDSDSSYAVEADYNIGLCYTGLEDFNTALYFFEKALKSSPSNDKIIDNASLSHKKLYPEESWTHPYNGFKRMLLSLNTNMWMLFSVLLTFLLSWVIYSIMVREKYKKNMNLIVLIIGIPLWLFTLYGVYVTYNHTRELHFLIPKNIEVATFLGVDGLESEEKLQIGKRYEIIADTQNEWVKIQVNSNSSLWVRKSDVNLY